MLVRYDRNKNQPGSESGGCLTAVLSYIITIIIILLIISMGL